jgi:hypothetical protein
VTDCVPSMSFLDMSGSDPGLAETDMPGSDPGLARTGTGGVTFDRRCGVLRA